MPKYNTLPEAIKYFQRLKLQGFTDEKALEKVKEKFDFETVEELNYVSVPRWLQIYIALCLLGIVILLIAFL